MTTGLGSILLIVDTGFLGDHGRANHELRSFSALALSEAQGDLISGGTMGHGCSRWYD